MGRRCVLHPGVFQRPGSQVVRGPGDSPLGFVGSLWTGSGAFRAAPTRTPVLGPCRRPGSRPCCKRIPGRPRRPLTPLVLSAEHLVCRGTHKAAALSLVGRPVVEMKAAHPGVGFTVDSVLWQVGPADWRSWSACRGHCGRHCGSLSVRCCLQQSFPLTDGARI